jgi:hypothetical protein
MTTTAFTTDRTQSDGVMLITWSGLANGSTGAAFMQGDWCGDRTAQVDGIFGAGGSLAIEGSIDGSNWVVLSDNTGNALNVTSLKVRNVFDAPLYFRPHVTVGDGTTSLRLILLIRRQLARPF